ncbi:MAG: hypothetical protein ABW221_05205 [Vicinamibacteria bacterium]
MSWLRCTWAWFRARTLFQLLLLNVVAAGGIRLLGVLAPHPGGWRLQTCFFESIFLGIVADWNASGLVSFVAALAVFDTLFPLAYAALLRRAYDGWCARLAVPPRPEAQRLPALAAAFDLVENALLLAALGAWKGGVGPLGALVGLVAVAALVKWALLLLLAIAFAIALFSSRWGWAVHTCRFGFVSVLVGAAPLIASSQGQDLLRILADRATGRLQWALAVVALVSWATSVWYWSRVLLMIRPHRETDDPSPRVLLWLPRVLGTAPLALVALAFVETGPGSAELKWPLWGHAGGCAVLALAFLYAVTRRRQWLSAFGLPPSPPRVGSWRDLPAGTRRLGLAAMATSAVLLVLITWQAVPIGRTLGAVAVVFLFAGHLAFAGSLAVFFSRLFKLPLVTIALVCAAFFSRTNDNHVLRLIPDASLDRRPPLPAAFDAWAADRLAAWPAERAMPVFLVAAEGGGIRAAYWAAVVLGRLTDRQPGFERQTFAISGVSGGSVGTAMYVSLLRDRGHAARCASYAAERGHGSGDAGPVELCGQEILRQDFLGPVLAKMLSPDLAQWFLPFPVPAFDRARGLEDSFAAAYRETMASAGFEARTLDQPSSSAWPRCDAPGCPQAPVFELPALLLNGTHVATGQRMLHAPLRWQPEELPDVVDLASLLRADVRLSTAAHDSARFAYVSPAGRLLSRDGEDYDHVVDGGYFENSGAATLQDVLHVIERSPHRPRLRLVVLYLCNSAERCWGEEKGADPEKPQLRPPDLTELFAPVRALLGARDARGELALAEISRTPERVGFVEFGVCPGDATQRKAPEPLGWQLSEGMRARLSEQAAGRAEAPGNVVSEGCVKDLLAGDADPPACRTRVLRPHACRPPEKDRSGL